MKTSLVVLTAVFAVLLSISLVVANPTMLPNHPGYPLDKTVDPVGGQSLANDPGQTNATGENSLAQASAYDDVHVKQSLSINRDDQRLLEKPGAGRNVTSYLPGGTLTSYRPASSVHVSRS